MRAALLAAPLALGCLVPMRAAAQEAARSGDARALAEVVSRDRERDAAGALEAGREALRILESEPDPLLRADVLAEMAWAEMVRGDYEDAFRRASRALDEAREAGYAAGEARALNTLGVVARRRGDALEALERFTESLVIRRGLGDPADVAMALNNLGFVYSTDLGDFDLSLEHHLEAMRIRETLGRPADLALSLNNIGVLYQAMGEPDRARGYLERALEIRREHDAPIRVAGTLSNLGEVLLEQGSPVAALERFRAALAIREAAGEPSGVAGSNLLIGRALTALDRHGEADASLRLAQAQVEALGETRTLARVHHRRGQLAAAREDWPGAEEHLFQAASLAVEVGALHMVAEVYESLADAREAAGDAAGALAAHRVFKRMADRVMDQDKARRVALLDARYEAERRQREIEELRHGQARSELQLAEQRSMRDMVALLAGGLLLVGVLLLRRRAVVAREVNRRLEVVARTDPLTGLYNRRAFVQKAEEERSRMQRSGRTASVILADVDHFKAFNDRHGHAVGDRVLRHVAGLLSDAVREQDSLARWGGEEFVLLLPETTPEGAAILAEKLRTSLAETSLPVDDGAVSLTMTFGVGEALPDASVDAWIAAADGSLYAGKAAGRDRVEVAAGG